MGVVGEVINHPNRCVRSTCLIYAVKLLRITSQHELLYKLNLVGGVRSTCLEIWDGCSVYVPCIVLNKGRSLITPHIVRSTCLYVDVISVRTNISIWGCTVYVPYLWGCSVYVPLRLTYALMRCLYVVCIFDLFLYSWFIECYVVSYLKSYTSCKGNPRRRWDRHT